MEISRAPSSSWFGCIGPVGHWFPRCCRGEREWLVIAELSVWCPLWGRSIHTGVPFEDRCHLSPKWVKGPQQCPSLAFSFVVSAFYCHVLQSVTWSYFTLAFFDSSCNTSIFISFMFFLISRYHPLSTWLALVCFLMRTFKGVEVFLFFFVRDDIAEKLQFVNKHKLSLSFVALRIYF